MSGIFCDGCGEGNLLPDTGGAGRKPVRCDLCGWTADAAELPSTWMLEDAPWTKRERKAAGRLYFLWIELDPDDDEAVFEVMRILGLEGMNIAPRMLVEVEAKPSLEALDQVRAVKSVRRVELVP